MKTSKSNKLSFSGLWLVGLVFFFTNSFFLAVFYLTLPPARTGYVRLEIPVGSSLRQISTSLVESRVIKDRYSFELLCNLRGLDKDLRAGTYSIPPGSTTWEVISLLLTGRGRQIKVTIPEGLTGAQAAGRLAAAVPALDSLRLSSLQEDKKLQRRLGVESPGMMGYLFPDTYFITDAMDETGVISLMVQRFQEVYSELTRDRPPATGLSRHESVILASIIEKEAVAARERPIIASVFLNRLRLKRPLESCATVLFVLGKHKSKLLYRDLEVESPYNTYLHRGLPPGPICNPGRASLEAALFPADTDYLYFVARGDGTHVFSLTLTEHNRAKRRIENGINDG
ncbi:MAG: endolytic transglycosylase MltG [Candidatus Glassbacteria bacterium]|nr:endolytic transglycosylase MltG [Candidatus Glassbacteria bacterium]